MVSVNFWAKLKRIGAKNDNFRSVKTLFLKESLKDSILWRYVARIPKGIPLPYPEGFCWLEIVIASLRTLYGFYRYFDFVKLTPEKLPFAESSMAILIVKLPSAKEI